MVRDVWERSEIIRTRDLKKADGTEIDAKKVAHQMIRNATKGATIRATSAFGRNLKSFGDTREGRAMQILAELGGTTTYAESLGRTRESLIKQISKRSPDMKKSTRGKIADIVTAYNASFDSVSSLSLFMALQDAGMTNEAAAAAALDTMNFRKSGSATPILRAMYAFANPAIVGGANLMGSLFDRKTGKLNWRVGIPRLVGYTVVALALQAFARAGSDDDEGGDLLDQVSNYNRNTAFNLQIGDNIVHVPLAFGIVRIANGLANMFLDVGTGEKTWTDAFNNFWSGVLTPAVSPIGDTDIDSNKRPFEAFAATFAPTPVKPLITLAINRTDFDSPIVSPFVKKDQFLSEQGRKSTAEFWKEAARTVRQITGIDMAPEQVQNLIRGYAGGLPSMAINQFIENPARGGR